jgi:hypothetical protein
MDLRSLGCAADRDVLAIHGGQTAGGGDRVGNLHFDIDCNGGLPHDDRLAHLVGDRPLVSDCRSHHAVVLIV